MPQLNKTPLAELPFFDFSGGQASSKRDLTRQPNEFKLVSNLIILPDGAGLRNTPGNQAFNSAALVSATTPIQGLGYYNLPGTGDFLIAVASTDIYRSTISGASFSSVTGAVSITAGRDNIWQIIQFDDYMVGVGGAPNAPFKVTNAGNASALAGSPPSTGTFVFSHANRLFIGTEDTLYHSVLEDGEDWTGTGSGSNVFNLGDGTSLVTGVELDINTCLVFKENSTHVLTGRTDPFPSFCLADKIGCAGKNAAIVADGLCYWITADARMAITDGQNILDVKEVPRLRNVSDEFMSIPTDRLPYICGTRHSGIDFDWIVWSVNKTDVDLNNDFAIIWDLTNKCFITKPSGLGANCFARTPDGTTYMGGFAGKVYECLVEDLYTEASEAGAVVEWKIASDALNLKSLSQIVQVTSMQVAIETGDTSTITVSYGYDHAGATNNVDFTTTVTGSLWGSFNWGSGLWSGLKAAFKVIRLLGRGNYFRWALSGSDDADVRISGLTLKGRQQGQKSFEVK